MGKVIWANFRGTDRWVDKNELGRVLGRSKRWIELRLSEGMPSHFDGYRRYFHIDTINEWLKEADHENAKQQVRRQEARGQMDGPPVHPWAG